MPNLYPDMSREKYEGSDSFIYAAPIEQHHWDELRETAQLTTETGVKWTMIQTLGNRDSFAILLRETQHTDDQMLETAAWLRFTLSFQGVIYAVPGKSGISISDTVVYTAGAPRHLCKMFDLPKEEKKDGK
jgi:hypothetical protein